MVSPSHSGHTARAWYQRDSTIILLFLASALTLLLVLPLSATALVLMWRYATWSKLIKWLLTAAIPLPWYLLLAGLVGSTVHAPSPPPPVTIGTVPVADPLSVAIGAHDSVYVLDQTHILHFSAEGHLLGRLGPSDLGTTIATDRAGDLYYVQQGRLVELAPTGRVLRQWPIGDVAFITVDRHGQVYATGAIAIGQDVTRARVKRYAATGRLLSQWTTSYGAMLAPAGDGFLYGIGEAGLARLDPGTGRVLARWVASAASGTSSYDAVAANAQGAIYVGDTRAGDTPFAIQKLTHTGRRYTFTSVNAAEEMVAGLAIDAQGNVYVIRDSYARPCASNLGLDKLSPAGTVIGTFRSCTAQGS